MGRNIEKQNTEMKFKGEEHEKLSTDATSGTCYRGCRSFTMQCQLGCFVKEHMEAMSMPRCFHMRWVQRYRTFCSVYEVLMLIFIQKINLVERRGFRISIPNSKSLIFKIFCYKKASYLLEKNKKSKSKGDQ